jgi:hypothetical protein
LRVTILEDTPADKFALAVTGAGRHGPHPQYTKQIIDHMQSWSEQVTNGVKHSDYSPEATAAYLRGLADNVKVEITGSTERINLLDLGLDHF